MRKNAALVATLFTLLAGNANAAEAPLPGGANQMQARSGVLGHTVWNGALRMNAVYVRGATPEEAAAFGELGAGQKLLAFEVKVRNGLSAEFDGLIEYTLADKDDVSVSVPTGAVTHASLYILQGAAAVQKGIVSVDKDFVPVKMFAICANCGAHSPYHPVRFAIPASSQPN